MAQLHGIRRIDIDETPQTPRAQASPTFEQLLRGDARYSLPILGKEHDHEEYYAHHNKKSVLTKVKEKAKKMRQSLSKKKHEHDDGGPPTSGVTLDNGEDEDEDDEDPEYLGAPMYESELAPEPYREKARQHPRAIPVVSEKHVLPGSVKPEIEQEKENPLSPEKTITETVFEKLGPAYAAVSDATHTIASKIAGLTVATPTATDTTECAGSGMQKLGRVPEIREHATGGQQTWDKGVSVKEYVMHKLEPGEDERALSQVITEAISPKKTPGDMGMVEKVREAVTSLLHNEESSQTTTRATNLTSSINPISTNPYQVAEEENSGRILQTN